MLTITSIVSVGAGIIIGSGIASKNSNINFANRFIRKTDFNLSVNKAYAGIQRLKNNNIPATFEDRNNLARSYGIENYTGTQEENDLFLRMLIGDEEPQNQPECYK